MLSPRGASLRGARAPAEVITSPKMNPRALVSAAVGYVRRNPDEILKAAVNAASLRFGVPLAALRYAAGQLKPGKRAPKDIEIATAPPALRLSASLDAMGTPVRASAAIKVDEVSVTPEAVRIGVRLSDVRLSLLAESDSPVATLIKSGALDLSKPGNLVKYIPKRPPAIVEAEGDRHRPPACPQARAERQREENTRGHCPRPGHPRRGDRPRPPLRRLARQPPRPAPSPRRSRQGPLAAEGPARGNGLHRAGVLPPIDRASGRA